MIKYRNAEAENYFTTGFETTLEANTVKVAAGVLNMREEEHSFPEFEFDLVSDDTFEVQYDVFLLNAPEGIVPIHIDRTELDANIFPNYEGETKLLYTLMSFRLKPNQTDFNSLDLEVFTAVMVNEDSTK